MATNKQEYWEVTNVHPITGFIFQAHVDMKKYTKEGYKPKKKYTEEVEKGVDKKLGVFRAVFLFGEKSNRRIVIKVCKSLEEAREAYQEYLNITPTLNGVYFSKHKFKYFAKYKGKVLWSKFKEDEKEFFDRIPSLKAESDRLELLKR